MTTRTIDELRAVLEARAATISPPPALASRTAYLARGVRVRRRVVAGATGLGAVAAAVLLPVAIGWPIGGVDGTEPADREASSRDEVAWTRNLPGLDLPEGEPLAGAYATGDVIVVDGAEIPMAQPVTSFISVPAGVVVELGRATGSVSSLATSLELVHDDGEVEIIDSGFIAGSAAARQPDGSVVLVYGWLETATAPAGEIRVREVGSDDPPRVIPVEPAATVLDLVGPAALIGYLADPGGYQALLDLETGTEERVTQPGDSGVSEGVTAGGLALTWDDDSQCLTARSGTGANAWERCDGTYSLGLSPDRQWILTHDGALAGALDAETGERVSTFALPSTDLALSPPSFHVRFLGWESAEHPVYSVGKMERQETTDGVSAYGVSAYVAVRCTIPTGSCERIPHPVDVMGELEG